MVASLPGRELGNGNGLFSKSTEEIDREMKNMKLKFLYN
jgi:hypothetical protein